LLRCTGFELIELKIKSNTPYDAALQVLRYGAGTCCIVWSLSLRGVSSVGGDEIMVQIGGTLGPISTVSHSLMAEQFFSERPGAVKGAPMLRGEANP
jgi:hypothetical protein